MHEASRTLVKSPPELWAEVSDAACLAKHLGEYGEIRITRLEPERAVTWEGEGAAGTVKIEPSGWGTRVILTAEVPPSEPEPTPEPAPEPEPEPLPPAALGFFGRMRRYFGFEPRAPHGEAAAHPEPAAPEPDPNDPTPAILAAALDSLGQAHHRPFSRA